MAVRAVAAAGFVAFAGLSLVAAWALWGDLSKNPGRSDRLAQCLTAKGVKMFGAYWCGHCEDQKRMFGESWKHVIYVECATPGTREQVRECAEAGILAYPTWQFPGGGRVEGVLSFRELGERSGCDPGGG